MTGFICGPRIYMFNRLLFEYSYFGPWPLKKDGDPKKRAGKGFFDKISEFEKLSEKAREKYRLGGGCVRF